MNGPSAVTAASTLEQELRAERERGQGDDDNVQLLQTPNLTGYRTPNDDIQTKREVENEA